MSPEIELLLSSVRPSAGAADLRRLAASADWGRFESLAKHHGLAPLVLQGAEALLPDRLSQELRRRAERVAKQNLYFTATLLRLLSELKKDGIEAVPYKGPTLAAELYGDVALREFCDLDLLVKRADVPRAVARLRQMGYREAFALTGAQEQAHLRSGCEIAMDDGRVPVEIHWDVVPRTFSLSLGEAFRGRTRTVSLAGAPVTSLGLEDLYIVLAVHGGTHLWGRLVWVSDVARLSARTLDWTLIERESKRIGAWRLVQLAAQVAHDLLGADLRLATDGSVRSLAATVRKKLEAGEFEAGEAARHRFLLRTRERWTDRARYLWRHAFTPGIADWQLARAPGPFYPMVRVARLVRKFGRVP